jgi:predicted phage terminase large subunit-like protein
MTQSWTLDSHEKIALASLAGFAWYASKGKWKCPRHLQHLNSKLMDVAAGRIKRLIITEPPRHGKSEFVSKYFPAWYLGLNPDDRVILTSYESGFAASWGRKARDLLLDNQNLFGIKINQDSSAVQDWNILKRMGGMNTAGVGGPCTGKGAKLFIIDDPVKNSEEAASETIRDKTWDWFKSTAYTRLEPDGAIIIIMTRWHDDDLVGRILKEQSLGGEKWEILNLPAIAEENDDIGRKKGEALWPERYPIKELERIKKAIGEFWFASMYQQRPVPLSGAIIKREWWKYYSTPPDRKSLRRYIWAWDTAVKDGEENDYSVGIYIGETENGYYILDVKREKMEYPDLKRAIEQYYRSSRASVIVVEDKSSGQQIIQEFSRGTKLPIVPTGKDKKGMMPDKVTRALLVTPMIQSGLVYLPENAPWLTEFLDECLKFPKGKHDDQVDALVYALDYLKNNGHHGIDSISLGAPRESANLF